MRQQTWTGSPASAITWMATNRQTGTSLLQELHGLSCDRQFGLSLRDPSACDPQLFLLWAAQAWGQPLVDVVLAAPGGDRLGADPKGLGDLSDRPSGLDQVQDPAAEL
jgi:hypothetical protein